MNTLLQQAIHTHHVADDWEPRPALREAMQRIATIAVDDSTALISDRSITFRNLTEHTTISAAPINADSWDGTVIAEIITIRTPLTTFKLFDEKDYAFINIFATTGAVVRDAHGKDALISRLALFEGDDAALADLYTPLIASAARLQLIGPLCGLYHFEGRKEDYDAARVALPGWDEPSRWDSREFEFAREQLCQHGAYAG